MPFLRLSSAEQMRTILYKFFTKTYASATCQIFLFLLFCAIPNITTQDYPRHLMQLDLGCIYGIGFSNQRGILKIAVA